MPETSKKHRSRRPEGAPTPEEDGSRRPVCTVAFCPICLAVTAAQGAAPETIDHLLSAAREFFLAARAVLYARGDDLAGATAARGTRLEKIEIG